VFGSSHEGHPAPVDANNPIEKSVLLPARADAEIHHHRSHMSAAPKLSFSHAGLVDALHLL